MISQRGDRLRLQCKILPRASRLRFGPAVGDWLKIQLPAPPVDGAANDALVRALAEAFGLPRRAITLVAGSASKQKIVEIGPLDAGEAARVHAAVAAWTVP